jgi:hypothetical protein
MMVLRRPKIIPEPERRGPGERNALAKSKVHQWSRARDYGSWVDLLTDLKNMAACQEWDKHTEDI